MKEESRRVVEIASSQISRQRSSQSSLGGSPWGLAYLTVERLAYYPIIRSRALMKEIYVRLRCGEADVEV
jgi:hypothetical protein